MKATCRTQRTEINGALKATAALAFSASERCFQCLAGGASQYLAFSACLSVRCLQYLAFSAFLSVRCLQCVSVSALLAVRCFPCVRRVTFSAVATSATSTAFAVGRRILAARVVFSALLLQRAVVSAALKAASPRTRASRPRSTSSGCPDRSARSTRRRSVSLELCCV